MARKKRHEEKDNHERWLISYADFITLLFAFFVVMYSISSVNEGKYRVLSSTLVSAFSHPAKTLDPIQYGTQLHAPIIQHKLINKQDKDSSVSRIGIDYQIMPSLGQMAHMEKIADMVKSSMKKLINEGLVTVNKTRKGVEIAINSEILFASGESHLSKNAQKILKKIASLLKTQKNHINVEGYTDNVPINTIQFPSNWELSAARAASVVHLFTEEKIKPQRLAAIGFGEYRPIASNVSPEGRKKNRRVTIMVLNESFEDKINLDKIDKQHNVANDISNGFKGRLMGGSATEKTTMSRSIQKDIKSFSNISSPVVLPLSSPDGRPSVIKLPPTNVIPGR